MKNIFSTFGFMIVLIGLGLLAYIAFPENSEADVLGASTLQNGNSEFSEIAGVAPETPAASLNLNMIAIPLDVSAQFTDAQGLASYLGSGISETSKWNAEFQVFETWYPEFDAGDLFSVETGDAIWVLVDNTVTSNIVSFVGDVPPQTGQAGAVQFDLVGGAPCKLNAISIPLDQSSITTESELVTALGGFPAVQEISKWNAEFQVYETWYAEFDAGDAFEVNIGYPFFVCLGSSTAANWP